MSKGGPTNKSTKSDDQSVEEVILSPLAFADEASYKNSDVSKADESEKNNYYPTSSGNSVNTAIPISNEIKDYCLDHHITKPYVGFVFAHAVAYTSNVDRYKILMSGEMSLKTFCVGVFAPSTHKIALAYCDNLSPVKDVIKIFKKLGKDNTPAVLQVAIVSGGDVVSDKVQQILDFTKESYNIFLKYYSPALNSKIKSLAIDTEGNFTTDCTDISVDDLFPGPDIFSIHSLQMNLLDLCGDINEFPLKILNL